MALPWGDARSQFQLVRAQVISEYGKGVSNRKIFEALRDEGKISMCEKTFYKYAAMALKNMTETPSGSAVEPPPKAEERGSNTPLDPLSISQRRPTGRFQMAPKIKDYK
ncbi:hypothetical protein ACQU0X_30195 [Pseudovibrio ascidiaceicola]|uniref:hypothetical protein n=1 Tax=Pseudovibrio ascidiaceicola TaxID=285279 RepID=UPI003D35C680